MRRESRLRAALRGDAGVALASTVFLGAIALLLLSVMIARALASGEVGVNQLDSEEALALAEGELDAYLADLLTQTDPDAVNTGHAAADLADRSGVISAAETLAATSPSSVIDAPGGEVVILKPSDAPIVYSVGFVPDMATVGRKVRIVTAAYQDDSTFEEYVVEYAVFGAGDVNISGSAEIADPPADVHANGTLNTGAGASISGCGSESESSGYSQPGCPTSPVAVAPTPVIEAVAYHEFAWYDLCADGAHFGPGHPTSPGGTTGTPCAGPLTATPTGWSGGGTLWSVNNKVITGVFFVSGGDVSLWAKSGSVATILVQRTYTAAETPGTCGQGTGGSIDSRSGTRLTGHGDTGAPPVALIADGDIDFTNSHIVGLVASGETLDFVGAGTTTITGAIVVADNCDEGLSMNGNPTIVYTGPFDTLFDYVDVVNGGWAIGLRGEI